ncbi:WhiB family transcriptional regulator [Yinghuangia soli]|uniref:Transcriptional regulator WhiB n=1 Tax=Yinghuangia soli TaxID=2908204 RepID=A0AA41Q8D5_9ACTN|nr:WhiB family transcriptional regulator [Yinghuangia soli]MCF2532077.1 WhiB family transcriptional regulator [Yinghuangia soli]
MDDSMTWMAAAACRGSDPAMFQDTDAAPQDGDSGHAAALRVCAACPVRARCLDWALSTRQPQGIWGGRTTADRLALLRAAQPPASRRPAARAAGPRHAA